MSLKDLDCLINDIMNVLADNDPSDELEIVLEEALANASAERTDKIEAICSFVRYLEKWAKIRQEESKRIAELSKSDFRKSAWLKRYLLASLEAHGETSVRTPSFNIAIANDGGKASLELLVDAVDLPDKYQDIEVVALTGSIRADLEAGEDLSKYARLLPRGKHLRIK